MKNKNGFTLIELLAVIVILALIAVIASPLIIGVIEDARIGAIEASADGAIKSVKSYYTEAMLKDPDEQVALPLTVDFAASPADGAVSGSALSMTGSRPTGGKVTLTKSGKVCVGDYTPAAGSTQESCDASKTTGKLVLNSYECTFSWSDQQTITCTKK